MSDKREAIKVELIDKFESMILEEIDRLKLEKKTYVEYDDKEIDKINSQISLLYNLMNRLKGMK